VRVCRSNTPGWATAVSTKQYMSCGKSTDFPWSPSQTFSVTPKICSAHAQRSVEFPVMSLPKTLTVPKGTTLTINGPAKSGRGFDLLRLAMHSQGTVTFSGPTELHDQKTGKLLATITGGSLPGTLHFTATAAGQNFGRKCVDDTKSMKAVQISCPAAKAMVGCTHDLHASFPKMPAGSLVSTICRVTCNACFAEPTRPGTITKKVGGAKATLTPMKLIQLEGLSNCPKCPVGTKVWRSPGGLRTSPHGAHGGGSAFTLYALPPKVYSGLQDTADSRGGGRYARECAKYGLVGVGCFGDYSACNKYNCLHMPVQWSCNIEVHKHTNFRGPLAWFESDATLWHLSSVSSPLSLVCGKLGN
jgi:hypothetical protein